jgi:hypothetical protein
MRFTVEVPVGEAAMPVWNDPKALTFLDRLISRADEAAHDVVLRDADLLDDSVWFTGARIIAHDRLLELCELARASAWATQRAGATWRVSTLAEAERALRIANSPLKVLVESGLRDGALIDVAVCLLAGEPVRRLRLNPPVPPVIDVLHSGGTGDMLRFMEQEANNARQTDIPLRLVVVVDSDKKSPEQPLSLSAERIRREALQLGARPFVLAKHEAENYIPDFHWQAELDRDPRNPTWTKGMTELLSMPADDRDYFDMKDYKRVPGKYDPERPYHLEVLLKRVHQEHEPAALAAMVADLRVRDHTGDLISILDLIDQER